ncbi:DNA-binding GntR family transcriptional regulator [Spinactinospora alkalitolerans]|uniref:DNA-binding GntR family transcriptional regulator n=1 Tax=Spinactinospora alkalitolerans TaxID=687207 RepID=A0A852U254_9ACTN|nr:GntR family transcriptional regulator [Spinactinospora alkalitolerans]NYE48224.1 DNA-binding GntR family transcriptional regulator [Spinactinospora alkalitolerans]
MSDEPRSTETAYRALARELRTAILQQRYVNGARLPTEAELARDHGVSRQTVRRAFQDLVAEGMVYRVPGRGTFATSHEPRYLRQFGSVEDLMGLSLDTDFELLAALRPGVDIAAAGRLRLGDDRIMTAAFRRLHDGIAFCVTRVFLPPEAGRGLLGVPDLTVEGSVSRVTVIGLLDSTLEHPIAEAEQSITVAGATAEVAAALSIAEGEPVLRIDRVYQDTRGVPVELAVSHFLPQHYTYRVRLRRSMP